MHDFSYKKGQLYCENVRVADIAKRVGTPFYLYSYKTFVDHLSKLQKAFSPIHPIICFSTKSNSNLAVLRALVAHGAGLDIVSGGELFRALKVGAEPKKIVYAGVGKTEDEIEFALKKDILLFNVESEAELSAINHTASRLGKIARVSIRLNPDVAADTHAHITTGTSENKFGIDFQRAHHLFQTARQYRSVDFCGVHVHIGSQITDGTPFVNALNRVFEFVSDLKRHGKTIRYMNLGGGLGVIYRNEKTQTAQQFADRILPLIVNKPYRFIFEPGRFISGNSGIFVTRVLYNKKTTKKNFVIVDGAMNDLIRPSLYGAYHDIWPVVKKSRKKVLSDVVGPVCESGDYFAKERELTELHEGELLAVMTAGAYGFTMSSNYNTRPRVAEVLVKGNKFEVVRKRETWGDCVKGETIPSFVG
jgi:diaminopimelate decarboxylase